MSSISSAATKLASAIWEAERLYHVSLSECSFGPSMGLDLVLTDDDGNKAYVSHPEQDLLRKDASNG